MTLKEDHTYMYNNYKTNCKRIQFHLIIRSKKKQSKRTFQAYISYNYANIDI